MKELKEWYQDIDYESAKIFLGQNIKTMTLSFVAVGYYLKYIRDTEGFREDGYSSVWEFAEQVYGLRRSTTTRWMAINDRFSKDGNSPVLAERYKDFGRSQLQEMLYLTDEQMEEVTPDLTVKEIREIRKPEPAEEVTEESLSALGRTEILREEIGGNCQFVDPGLAKSRAGDDEPVPCCKECGNPCAYECGRSAAKRKAEKREVKSAVAEAEEEDELLCDDCANASSLTGNPDQCANCGPDGRNFVEIHAETCATSHTEKMCGRFDGYACDIEEVVKKHFTRKGNIEGCAGCCGLCLDKGKCEYTCEAVRENMAEEERIPGQKDVQDYPELVPEPVAVKDEAWFVKEYFSRYGSGYLPELMRICRENKSNSDRAKGAQKLIAPYGAYGGGSRKFAYDFHGFSGGVDFRADGQKLHMKYGRFIEEMLKLYDPWEPQWLPAETREPEEVIEPEISQDSVETVSGEVEDATPEKPETVAEEPRFSVLLIRDILWDKEQELEQMEECNKQPDGKLPKRMMLEHRAVVAGLRLLLELTETLESKEAEDEES